MRITNRLSLIIALVATAVCGCNNHGQKVTDQSKPDITEEKPLDARLTMTPDERSGLLAAISRAGNGEKQANVHVIEEAGKLKFVPGSVIDPEQARAESTVALANHSDDGKPPVKVRVTPGALKLMETRRAQGGAP